MTYSVLLAVTATFCMPALAGTVDSADFCVSATEMQFDINLSSLNPEAFDIILRVSPDAGVFTSTPRERIAVNFDLDSGAITRQEPIVETLDAPTFDRWVDGPIDDFNIVATGDGNAHIFGSVLLGSDKLLAGDEISSVGVRDGATTLSGAHPITACPPPPGPFLEHVNSEPRAESVAMSGDGEWIAWTENFGPELTLQNLTTGVQTVFDMSTVSGEIDMKFPDPDNRPALSNDGSVIAVEVIYDPVGENDIYTIFVMTSAGVEIARLEGTDYYGDPAYFQYPYIDGSGRYVIFQSDATNLHAVLSDGNGPNPSVPGGLSGYYQTWRLDLQLGTLELVTIEPDGKELRGSGLPHGISENGRYVLFEDSTFRLPGGNNIDQQLYLRDMTSLLAEATTLVSVDETGAPSEGVSPEQGHYFSIGFSDIALAFPDETAGFPEDGLSVVFTVADHHSSDGKRHNFLWTPAAGSKEIFSPVPPPSDPGTYSPNNFYDRSVSANGKWLSSSNKVFGRLNIITGSAYPVPNDAGGSPIRINDPHLSRNGEVVFFLSSDLTIPDGEVGSWWVLRYDPIPGPIVISVTETVPVSDAKDLLLGIILPVAETVSVSDDVLVIPPLNIAVAESVGVSDDIVIKVGPTLADTIDLALPPGPLLPGMTFTASAGGFKPFTPVQAFLQSEPVLVGEEMADADGNVTFQITVPLDFPPGDHTLILLGQKPDGSERQLTAAIRIDPPDTIFKSGFE